MKAEGDTISIRFDELMTCAECGAEIVCGDAFIDFEVNAEPATGEEPGAKIHYAPRLICPNCTTGHAFHPLAVRHLQGPWPLIVGN
jgi:hypothetical protein